MACRFAGGLAVFVEDLCEVEAVTEEGAVFHLGHKVRDHIRCLLLNHVDYRHNVVDSIIEAVLEVS